MKKSRSKVFLCIALASVISLSSFTGCSSTKNNSSSGSGTAKPETLTIMHYLVETGKLKALNDTVAGFEKAYPNITVNVQGMSLDQYTNTLNMKISAGDEPDIIFGNPKSDANLVQAGDILDLTNEAFTKNIDPSALKDCTFNNKVYGIPMDLMLSGVIYNKDIFSKYNIQIPTTFSDFVTVMQTLKSDGVTPIAAGYKDMASVGGSYWCQSFGNMLSQDPGMFGDIMDGTKKPSDFPLLNQFLTQWQTINTFTSPDATSVGVDRSEQDFASGKAAMIIIGSWAISAIRQYGPNGNFGAFLFPFFDDASQNKMQYNTDDTWMIASGSANLDAAKKFFSYMTTKDAATTWSDDASAVSAITGVTSSKLDPILADMDATLKSGAAYNVDQGICLSGQFQSTWDNQMQAWCFTKPGTNVGDWIKSSFDPAIANAITAGT